MRSASSSACEKGRLDRLFALTVVSGSGNPRAINVDFVFFERASLPLAGGYALRWDLYEAVVISDVTEPSLPDGNGEMVWELDAVGGMFPVMF